jgi:hypothetical protein
MNPSFGGNVFNAQHLMAMATAQNEYKRKAEEDAKRSRQQAARAKARRQRPLRPATAVAALRQSCRPSRGLHLRRERAAAGHARFDDQRSHS